MRILVTKDYGAMSCAAARLVGRRLLAKPSLVVGLPTGETPKGMYAALIQMYKSGLIDFSEARFFNLDEYYGLSPDNVHGFKYYMRSRFFQHINAAEGNIYIPDGLAGDVQKQCRAYEDTINNIGPIDIQVVGMGSNGLFGYNEPGSAWDSVTRLVTLSHETRTKLVGEFEHLSQVPEEAITVGIKTVMQSRSILLAASGPEKAEAVRRAVEGCIETAFPASVFQLHPDLTVLLDREAAAGLKKVPVERCGDVGR